MRSQRVMAALVSGDLVKIALNMVELGDGPAATVLERSINTPLHRASIDLGARMMQAHGEDVYGRDLIPGFESTDTDKLFALPTQEQYAAQIAAGETPHYEHEARSERMDDKAEKKRGMKIINTLAKLAVDVGAHTSYEIPDASPRKDQITRGHINNAFAAHDAGDLGELSTTPEIIQKVALSQGQLYHMLGTDPASEPRTWTAPHAKPITDEASTDRPGRAASEMFDSMESIDRMIPEEIVKSSSAQPWDDDYVGKKARPGEQSNTLTASGMRNPLSTSTAQAWREHASTDTSQDAVETANPGPQLF